jgi:hypothetical protein
LTAGKGSGRAEAGRDRRPWGVEEARLCDGLVETAWRASVPEGGSGDGRAKRCDCQDGRLSGAGGRPPPKGKGCRERKSGAWGQKCVSYGVPLGGEFVRVGDWMEVGEGYEGQESKWTEVCGKEAASLH